MRARATARWNFTTSADEQRTSRRAESSCGKLAFVSPGDFDQQLKSRVEQSVTRKAVSYDIGVWSSTAVWTTTPSTR